MQGQRIRSVAEQEDQTQVAVLMHLLSVHPAQQTIEEVIAEMAPSTDEFDPTDDVQQAIHDLTKVGLVHRNGQFVFPTRAAVRFHELPK